MFLYNYIEVPKSALSVKFLGAYVLSVALLIISSKIQVPMIPVPITLQTVAILLLPALFGMRLSLSALASWLVLGSMGLPVFAGNLPLPGFAYFMAPTGGYFIGFIITTILTAFAVHKMNMKGIAPLMGLFLIMHGLILLAGWVWLAFGLPQLGAEKAWLVGVFPFLIGSILKSAILVLLTIPARKDLDA